MVFLKNDHFTHSKIFLIINYNNITFSYTSFYWRQHYLCPITATKIPVNYVLSVYSECYIAPSSSLLFFLAPLQLVLTNSKELNLHILTFANQCVLGKACVVLTMMYSVIKVPGVYLITAYRHSDFLSDYHRIILVVYSHSDMIPLHIEGNESEDEKYIF